MKKTTKKYYLRHRMLVCIVSLFSLSIVQNSVAALDANQVHNDLNTPIQTEVIPNNNDTSEINRESDSPKNHGSDDWTSDDDAPFSDEESDLEEGTESDTQQTPTNKDTAATHAPLVPKTTAKKPDNKQAPQWRQFIQHSLAPYLTAIGVGALSGNACYKCEKSLGVQSKGMGVKKVFSWILWAAIKQETINTLDHSMTMYNIPHDPNGMTMASSIASWLGYYYA